FFFFQAEDGIRDFHVTGVQTCALPILFPGQTVTITDAAAYGLIMMQGYGTMNDWTIETPALIRYGQLTFDEYFVSEEAAKRGVTIQNHSTTDPIRSEERRVGKERKSR